MGRRKQGKYPYVHTPLYRNESYAHTSPFLLRIASSSIANAGKGVFTDSDIPNGTYIDSYRGEFKKYNPMTGYYLVLSDELGGIDAYDFPRCYMAMINDPYRSSFQSNCEFRIEGNIAEVWSTRFIRAGEELFINYGPDYFTL